MAPPTLEKDVGKGQSLGGRKIDKIDKMAEIGGRMAAIYQVLGLALAPISTICRGGRKMVEMVEMGAVSRSMTQCLGAKQLTLGRVMTEGTDPCAGWRRIASVE
jgi:hypothetical protein